MRFTFEDLSEMSLEWIVIKFDANIHVPIRINSNNFDNP